MTSIQAHCVEIERCNQRGGRMLSIVDLIEAGTLTRELAAYSLAAIRNGASFMVGALPSGAGKTTVMGALLNLIPKGVPLVAADSETVIEKGIHDRRQRRCYICHEIGPGPYYAYLWGDPLRRYFELPAAGHIIATNLHADTFEQARQQICDENGVPPASFRRMNLLYFLAVERHRQGSMRRIVSVWESDGTGHHKQVFDGEQQAKRFNSLLVSGAAMQTAAKTIDRLMSSGVHRIEDIRAILTAEEP
jgi:hypothetical protein